MTKARRRKQAPDRSAVSVGTFIIHIWRHCRARPEAVAMILTACLLETGLFWAVPLSFRSLVDNVLGPRDHQRFVLVLTGLAAAVVVAAGPRFSEAAYMRNSRALG